MCTLSTTSYADATGAVTRGTLPNRRPRIPARWPRTSPSERRRVLAEHVAHRPAHLAERAAVLQCRADRQEEVARTARHLAQLLQVLLDERLVAVGLEGAQAFHLQPLGLGVDAQE